MKTSDNALEKISVCRSCGSRSLSDILSLGELFVSAFVDEEEQKTMEKYPLDLILCDESSGGCGLLQLKHTVPSEVLYRNYWYRSGTNKTMTEELGSIVRQAKKLVPSLGKDDFVIDIGCNDGTLLRSYGEGVHRVGFEPSKNLAPVAAFGATKVINDFFNFKAWEKEFPGKKAKVITAIAMFYDLPDPNAFVSDVGKCLDRDGVFIIQMSYLPLMLSQNAFDNICVKPETVILGDNKPISDYSQGSYAFGNDGRLAKVLNTMQREYKGELVKIKPTYLEPIVTTPEHPVQIVKKEFLRFDGGQIKPSPHNYRLDWVPAKEVKKGDWVVMPKLAHENHDDSLNLIPFNKIQSSNYRFGLKSLPLNADTAWLLGLYTAEGHIGGRASNPYINFTLNKNERHLVEKIKTIVKSLGYTASESVYDDRNSVEVRVVCAALARALPKWVGKGALQKHIPDFILLASPDIKVAFLRGLFDGDGYIKKNKVHFHTSSKTLALQTQLLVASLGGMLGISYIKPYVREIRGGRVISKDSWQLRGSSKCLAKIFDYEYRGREVEHVISGENYTLVPVKKVDTELYNGLVYNIETESNTYLVSNAVVHNCHEHLEYYSLSSLEHLLGRNGLEVFDVETNDTNGGSFRVFMRHKGAGRGVKVPAGAEGRLAKMRREEKVLGLHERKVYDEFVARVEQVKAQLTDFVKKEVANGKKVYVYGASTKGNTLLQFFDLKPPHVSAAAERSQYKWGKNTVGTLIPIISEEQARADKPDYFLVLPWHFLNEFVEREDEYLRSGGSFIVPLPQFRIVSRE